MEWDFDSHEGTLPKAYHCLIDLSLEGGEIEGGDVLNGPASGGGDEADQSFAHLPAIFGEVQRNSKPPVKRAKTLPMSDTRISRRTGVTPSTSRGAQNPASAR